MLGFRPLPKNLLTRLRYDGVTALYAVMAAAAVAAAVSFPVPPASESPVTPTAAATAAPIDPLPTAAACSDRAWPYTCVYTARGKSTPVRVIAIDRQAP